MKVVFDLGGVVLNWYPQKVISDFWEDREKQKIIIEQMLQHPDWAELDRGAILLDTFLEQAALRTGTPKQDLQNFMQIVSESLTLKEGTAELIEELHAQGIELYVISNMPVTTWNYLLQAHSIWSKFSGIVISGLIQRIKPSKEIFQHFFTEYRLQPQDCLFIDDLPANIKTASETGMDTILFTNPEECRVELEKRALLLH